MKPSRSMIISAPGPANSMAMNTATLAMTSTRLMIGGLWRGSVCRMGIMPSPAASRHPLPHAGEGICCVRVLSGAKGPDEGSQRGLDCAGDFLDLGARELRINRNRQRLRGGELRIREAALLQIGEAFLLRQRQRV